MAAFEKAKSGVLFCTEASIVGLECKGLSHIVYYDIPQSSPQLVAPIKSRVARSPDVSVLIFLLPHEGTVMQLLSNTGVHVLSSPPAARLNLDSSTSAPMPLVRADTYSCLFIYCSLDNQRLNHFISECTFFTVSK